jgi:hypothetical protein
MSDTAITDTSDTDFTIVSYPKIEKIGVWGMPDEVNIGGAPVGHSILISAMVTDPSTPEGGLTVYISYKAQSESKWTKELATSLSGADEYGIFWNIPLDATTGLYDVKVEATNPSGRSTSVTEEGKFRVDPFSLYIDTVEIVRLPEENIGEEGIINPGDSIRILTEVLDYFFMDPWMESSSYTVYISYKAQSESTWTSAAASFYEGKWYIDWEVPHNAATGLYDVKVEASTPEGGSSSALETGRFIVAVG